MSFSHALFKAFVARNASYVIKKAFSKKYLLFTNIGISCSLSGLGDVIEQQVEYYQGVIKRWDPIRTRNMAIAGISVGTVCHFWYMNLDKLIPGQTLRIVFTKVMLDMLIGSPLYLSAFFVTLNVAEGSTKEQIVEEFKDKSWKLYLAEWIIWPPAQFVNFYFLSTKYRVLFDNGVSLLYDVFASKIMFNHRDTDTDDLKKQS
ncbi:unnamed protein product [Acanthoscelides obtectus]|uniref:Mpv17-like protein 2 n=1 Tax=Acanthoscelides obtectus TaxID=200917 RepID=A0A9P0M552_ACAOB|nr:unnamed protein product [Acanthoscelides obtectus]CAK1665132.1 Mpv17-like protein 2 [Acanthoscelides obtectus]